MQISSKLVSVYVPEKIKPKVKISDVKSISIYRKQVKWTFKSNGNNRKEPQTKRYGLKFDNQCGKLM